MSKNSTEKPKDFETIKNEYHNARKAQWTLLYDYLSGLQDFKPLYSKRAGHGGTNYTSGSRMDAPYDLSNWLYIELEHNNVNFCISLQPFDQDPNARNRHVLFDRIGIYAYVGPYSPEDAFKNMMVTNISLPFTEEKLTELITIIDDLSNCELFKAQTDFQEICNKHNIFTPSIY